MLFLIEANEKYIDELEQFKNEVLIYDKDNDNQFEGVLVWHLLQEKKQEKK